MYLRRPGFQDLAESLSFEVNVSSDLAPVLAASIITRTIIWTLWQWMRSHSIYSFPIMILRKILFGDSHNSSDNSISFIELHTTSWRCKSSSFMQQSWRCYWSEDEVDDILWPTYPGTDVTSAVVTLKTLPIIQYHLSSHTTCWRYKSSSFMQQSWRCYWNCYWSADDIFWPTYPGLTCPVHFGKPGLFKTSEGFPSVI